MQMPFPQISKFTKIRYAFMAVLFLALATLAFSQIGAGKTTVNADNCPGNAPVQPAFNIWPLSFSNQNCADLPLIDAKVLNGSGRDARYAASQAEHDAGVNVKNGDQVRVAIYFHNGASPEKQLLSTAYATQVGVNSEVFGQSATTHTLRGSISASGVRTVTSGDVNTGGDISLRSATPTKLTYVPGSTQLCIKYDHAVERKNAGDSSIDLNRTCGLDMQKRPQILIDIADIAPSGSTFLGNIPACFPYSGVVIFTLGVSADAPQPVSDVSIQKSVRNVTAGQGTFIDTTKAEVNDVVEFQMVFKNNGNASTQVFFKDIMPSGLSYIPGSINFGESFNTMFTNTGASILVGQGVTYTLTYRANVLSVGTHVNTVNMTYNNKSASDTATVVVDNVIPEPTDTSIALDKTVRNVTTNGSFAETANAMQGDTVEYKIVLRNTGNRYAEQILVKDSLPSGIELIPGTVTTNGSAFPDSLVNGSGVVSAVSQGASVTFNYRAKVSASAGTIVNTVTAQGPTTNSASDTATVIVKAPVPTSTTLSISKVVRNTSVGQTIFADSTNAKNQETVEFQITVTNTGAITANNVVIKDFLPAGLEQISVSNPGVMSAGSQLAPGQSIQLVITAKVATTEGTLINTASAQGSNTNTVSDSANVIVNTPQLPTNTTISVSKTVRNPSANVNTYSENVEAKKDDVVEFRLVVTNTGTNTAKNVFITDSLPNGLTANSADTALFTGNGLSLGDIAVNSSKTVTFTAKVTANSGTLVNSTNAYGSNTNTATDNATVTVKTVVVNNSLTISKKLRDLTQGQTAYVDSTNVQKNNIVQYQIIVTNTGNGTLTNVKITDNLPTNLQVQSGSFGISIPGNTSTLSNIVVSSLAPGASVTVNFSAKVVAECLTITNTASAYADQVSTVNDSASVNVNCQPTPQDGTLSITKQVKNLTQGNGSFVKQVSANSGDRVAYQIKVTAQGGKVTNVTLTDTLPSSNYFSYVAGSGKLNNSDFNDSFTKGNVNIGNLENGQTATIYFEGTISNSMPVGQTTLVNTASASGDRLGTVSDSATVTVNVQGSSGYAQMSIAKLVRNSSSGFQESVNAQNNDVVTFQITVTNTGTLSLNNAYVSDILPNGLVLRNGTVRLDNSNASDALISNRLNLGSMNPGQQRIITFEATVNSNGNTTLTNTAQAGADNYSQIQDTASVFLSQVQGSFVNIVQSKRANNDTKNIDATAVVADKGNIITYTLTVQNTGNASANNYMVADDLSQVLNYATMIDPQGGQMNGNVISWPGMSIPAYGTVTKSFRVQVKNDLAPGTYTLVNTFGNTVAISLNSPQVLGVTYVAPKTGPTAAYAFGFAAMITLAFAMFRRNGYLKTALARIPKIEVK